VSVFLALASGVALAQRAGQATHGAAARSQYDFTYRVEGDRRVAPVQVFDDGQRTYMQFRVGQLPPAIFTGAPHEARLAAVAWQGGYAVVSGTARDFTLRIGDVFARVRYEGRAPRSEGGGFDAEVPPGLSERALVPGAAGRARVAADADVAGDARSRPAAVQPPSLYEATPADRTMRQALARWAKAAGWTFQDEHWAVDVDIPLVGAARLGTDFKSAVRELLASTELSWRPLQPCFYSNRVLRVIPYAESCDRTAPAAARQG